MVNPSPRPASYEQAGECVRASRRLNLVTKIAPPADANDMMRGEATLTRKREEKAARLRPDGLIRIVALNDRRRAGNADSTVCCPHSHDA